MQRLLTTASLTAALAIFGSTTPSALTGVQPVYVVYATRNLPAFTLDQVRTNALVTAKMVDESSYGQHTLDVQVVGPFRVPSTTYCPDSRLFERGTAYGKAAEDAARAAGVVFPSGIQPWVHSDCGHSFALYTSTIAGAKEGLLSDGKMQGYLYGRTIGLQTAYAEVIPYIGTNPFDPYSPMGYMPKGGYSARERVQETWIPASQVRNDFLTTLSAGTQFIETTEWPLGTGRLKSWTLQNGVQIEVRNFGLSQTVKRPASSVILFSGQRLDLDRINLCRWYTLTLGQIYTRGDGLGIRNDGLASDGSGATITAFPYSGPISASCPTGTIK
jgi:hypothetical protein